MEDGKRQPGGGEGVLVLEKEKSWLNQRKNNVAIFGWLLGVPSRRKRLTGKTRFGHHRKRRGFDKKLEVVNWRS